jgi:hypothetical protein
MRIESNVGVKPVRNFLWGVYLRRGGGVVTDKYRPAAALYAAGELRGLMSERLLRSERKTTCRTETIEKLNI